MGRGLLIAHGRYIILTSDSQNHSRNNMPTTNVPPNLSVAYLGARELFSGIPDVFSGNRQKLSVTWVIAVAIGKRSRGAAIGLLFYDFRTCIVFARMLPGSDDVQ